MSLLNSALHIGRSAILSYQGALQAIGSNISSAGSPDYTRLNPQLDPLQGNELTRGLQPGAGVALTDIQRVLDEALESRVRLSVSRNQAAATRHSVATQVESYFDDLSGSGIGGRLRGFLNGFDELQNAPEDAGVRDLVLANAALLADAFHTVRGQLAELGASTDAQITDLVGQANEWIASIADLNERITRAEAGGGGVATGLRDQRDALLRRLSELFDVTVLEQPDGAINVYVGSEALAQGATFRELAAFTDVDGEFRRTTVHFADTGSEVPVRGGRLEGLVTARDSDAYGPIAELDRFAAAMIAEINRLHADGQGLTGLKSATGAFDVLDTGAALNTTAAGLPIGVQPGSFVLAVADDTTGVWVAHEIRVAFDGAGGDATLESLVESINTEVEGVTASITPDRRLSVVADDGFSFSFGFDGQHARGDSSGVLAALGLNSFFTGRDAQDIAVNAELLADSRRIAAAVTPHPGDGVNAGRIAKLDVTGLEALEGAALPSFYTSLTTSVAVATAASRDDAEAAESILTALQAQKESISGVSLDEEAIALLKYERAFQGASRFVQVVDDLLGELVNLIR